MSITDSFFRFTYICSKVGVFVLFFVHSVERCLAGLVFAVSNRCYCTFSLSSLADMVAFWTVTWTCCLPLYDEPVLCDCLHIMVHFLMVSTLQLGNP